MIHLVLLPFAFLTGVTVASSTLAAASCADARPETVERLICEGGALAALDEEMARLYDLAETGASGGNAKGVAVALLRAEQGAWRETRHVCSGRDDTEACLTAAYLARIAELRAAYPAATGEADDSASIGPVDFRCGDGSLARLTFVESATPLAWLQRAPDAFVLEIQRSASGARYGGETSSGPVEFWNKGDDARLTLPDGIELSCSVESGG